MLSPKLKLLSGVLLTSFWLAQSTASAQLVGLVDFESNDGGYTVQNGGEGGGVPAGPWVFNASAATWSADGGTGVVNSRLTSPTLTVLEAGPVTVTFTHRYNFEDDGTTRWDAGALRISVNGGPFVQVLSENLTGENYKTDKTIGGNSPPLTGLFAFNNTSPGFDTGTFVSTTADLGAFNAEDTIAIQFVGAWDEGFLQTPAPNWEVSTVEFVPALEDRTLRVAPIITTQPSDAVVVQGKSHTLEVAVDGDPIPTVQWYKDGVPIPDATQTTYTITNMSPSDVGGYFVRALNLAGTTDSTVAQISITDDVTPPTIVSVIGLDDRITILVNVDEPLETDPLLSSAEDPFSYSLEEVGGTEVLFFATAVVSNSSAGTQIVLELITPRDPTKDYDLRVFGGVVTDLFGNAIDYDDNVKPLDTLFMQEVLSFDSVWEYDQSGVDPGDWLSPSAPAFPNSGPGVLGQETSGEVVELLRTDLTSPGEGSGTFSYYFRTRFSIGSLTGLQRLTIDYYVDDAAVVYINGIEVHRTTVSTSIPGNPGDPIPFGTQPSGGGAVGDASLTAGIDLPISALVEGENVISVYNGQFGGNSSDVVWGARLEITGIAVKGVAPTIVTPPSPVTADEYESVALSVVATPAPLDYQWIKDGIDIPGEVSPNLSFAPAVPSNSGLYSVRVSNNSGTATSPAVQVTINPDITAPTILSVVADGSHTSIAVTYSEPVTGATATNTANYAVAPTSGGAPLAILEASIDGSGRVVTLTTDPKDPGLNYDLSVSAVQDLAETPNTIANTTVGVTLTVPIFTTGHIWSYDERDVDLGTEWRAVGFDDSTWPSGPSILGFEANLTIATPWQQTFPGNPQTTTTYYVRSHFNYEGDPALAALTANLRFDDGFILYLNGVEVARQGFTGEAFHTNFFASHESSVIDVFAIDNANLVSGDNVLAAEIHQTSLGSSDAVWDMELVNIVDRLEENTDPPSNVVITPPGPITINEGATTVLTVSALGMSPITYQWKKDGADLPGETGPSLAVGESGSYTAVANNSLGTAESQNSVVVTLNLDLTPPTVVSCVANMDGSSFTITFDEAMDPATAQATGNYAVSGGSGVTAAVLDASGTTVVLTAPRPGGANFTITITGVKDASITGNLLDPNPTVCVPAIELLGAAADWSYDESNNDPGATWNTVGFDDSLWPTGTGIFGFEANLTITTPWDSAAGTTNFYLRTHFDGARHVAAENRLELRALYDDGFVAYLNGVEVARAGLDPANDPVEHGDLAASHEATSYETFVIDATGLLAGDNVLAVRVHQQGAGSSDAVWDATVVSAVPPCDATGLAIVSNGDGTVTITWNSDSGAQLWSAATANGAYSDTGETSPYTFTPAGGVTFYQAVCP